MEKHQQRRQRVTLSIHQHLTEHPFRFYRHTLVFFILSKQIEMELDSFHNNNPFESALYPLQCQQQLIQLHIHQIQQQQQLRQRHYQKHRYLEQQLQVQHQSLIQLKHSLKHQFTLVQFQDQFLSKQHTFHLPESAPMGRVRSRPFIYYSYISGCPLKE